MTIQLVRKPPIGNVRSEHLKATLAGNHTIKQQACIFMQLRFCLHQAHGIDFAEPTDSMAVSPPIPTSWNVRGSSATNSTAPCRRTATGSGSVDPFFRAEILT